MMNFRCQVLSLLVATACLPAPAGGVRLSPDARIEAAARKSYTFRVHLKGDALQVAAHDGVVTLTGTVADAFHKALAEATVQDLPGVKSVDNQLLLRLETPRKPSDAWLVTKVKAALRYHRNIDPAAVTVEAKDGVVTLSGRAASSAQRALTTDIVRNVEGVTDVKDNLKVASGPGSKTLSEKIDDASVTAQVKAVLLAHRGTHMLATRVKTDRGVVTLRGEARNAAEKDLVQRLVAGVSGVRRVDNRMTVGAPQ